MNPEDSKDWIINHIDVNRMIVTLAKAFIVKLNETSESKAVLNNFLSQYEAVTPIDKVVIHDSIGCQESLKQVAKSISYKLAFCEAVWELIGVGLIIPGGNSESEKLNPIQWTTVLPGHGGRSSSWRFDEYMLNIPRHLIKPLSKKSSPMPLTDGDLYMKELKIKNLHEEIEIALRESIHCFRHELYLASLAMLGKAVEGSWVELGFSLVPHISDTKRKEKFRNNLESRYFSLARKIKLVLDKYSKNSLKPLRSKTKVKPEELKHVAFWSDTVRESRNYIHFGAEPPMKNSFDKVATLLISAVPNISTIYKVRNIAISN